MDQPVSHRPAPPTVEAIAVTHTAAAPAVDERRHTMTIRVYDWCPEYGAHTDPELRTAYTDLGV